MQSHLKTCPHCNAQLSELAQICIDCGYSFTLDKLLKSSMGSRLAERFFNMFKVSGKAVFKLILLLLLIALGYGGYHFYKEYGLDYWNYKYDIANGEYATAVRRDVRDSKLWNVCAKISSESGSDRPYFTFYYSSVDGKSQFQVKKGAGKDILYGVETTEKVSVASIKDQVSISAHEVLFALLNMNPDNIGTLAADFDLLGEKDRSKVIKFLRKAPKEIPLEKLMSGLKVMISKESNDNNKDELRAIAEIVEKKIELNEKSAKIMAVGKARQNFMNCFRYLSNGSQSEKIAALTTLLRYPLSAGRRRFNLLEIVLQSEKRSLDARCIAAWMLAGYVGSKYHSQALELLERVKAGAPEKLQSYVKLASQMYLFKLGSKGINVPGTKIILVPVLVQDMQNPVLLKNLIWCLNLRYLVVITQKYVIKK